MIFSTEWGSATFDVFSIKTTFHKNIEVKSTVHVNIVNHMTVLLKAQVLPLCHKNIMHIVDQNKCPCTPESFSKLWPLSTV